jgi:predicted heme/steroid binding protein
LPSFTLDPLSPPCKRAHGVDRLKEFGKEALAQYHGKNGAPAYIGYKGNVYDVSGSSLWRHGDHQYRHHAGRDLTDALREAPHGEDMLERVVLIGTLHED